MLTVICVLIGVIAGLIAYVLLDAIVTHDLRLNRVGGLTHWRVGRYGGSFYRKAR